MSRVSAKTLALYAAVSIVCIIHVLDIHCYRLIDTDDSRHVDKLLVSVPPCYLVEHVKFNLIKIDFGEFPAHIFS